MKTLRLRFYPLKEAKIFEDETLIINFDEFLIKEISFDESVSLEEIEEYVNLIKSFDIIHVDGYSIIED
jgi:hypothetical protein